MLIISLFDYYDELLWFESEGMEWDDDSSQEWKDQEWKDYEEGLCDFITNIFVQDSKINIDLYSVERSFYSAIEEKLRSYSVNRCLELYRDYDEKFVNFLLSRGWVIKEKVGKNISILVLK